MKLLRFQANNIKSMLRIKKNAGIAGEEKNKSIPKLYLVLSR